MSALRAAYVEVGSMKAVSGARCKQHPLCFTVGTSQAREVDTIKTLGVLLDQTHFHFGIPQPDESGLRGVYEVFGMLARAV